MTTNNAVEILTNSSRKLDACCNYIENGAPLVDPGLITPPESEPNPEVTADLASIVKQFQGQVDSLFAWAETH